MCLFAWKHGRGGTAPGFRADDDTYVVLTLLRGINLADSVRLLGLSKGIAFSSRESIVFTGAASLS